MEAFMFGWRMNQLRKIAVFATVCLLSASSVVWAQDTSALSGQITDPAGKVIPGATVTLTNTATGNSRTARSSEDGSYTFSQVTPGTYKLHVEGKGFKAA